MSKVVSKEYGNVKTILKYNEHVSRREVFSAAGVTADANGNKIIPAGTIYPANDATAVGVVLNDVDVTYGDATGALVIHGFIDLTKLPTAPDDAAVAALKQITFE